jgi:hypothetical protein
MIPLEKGYPNDLGIFFKYEIYFQDINSPLFNIIHVDKFTEIKNV